MRVGHFGELKQEEIIYSSLDFDVISPKPWSYARLLTFQK